MNPGTVDHEYDTTLALALAPARAYRELMYRPDGQVSRWIETRYDVVARPFRRLSDSPRAGDVLLRVALGRPGPAECCVLVDPGLTRHRAGGGHGPPGWYAAARAATGSEDGLTRRILDASGRLPPGHVVLRPRPSDTGRAFGVDEAQNGPQVLESPSGGPTSGGQLTLPAGSTDPDLVLRWNAMSTPMRIDIVVHFHGNNTTRANMHVVDDILAISGLDLADPDNPAAQGRRRPTLAILPKGQHVGGLRFRFPALVTPGGLDRLIDDCLRQFAGATGVEARRGRLVLTAHSGGGITVEQILAGTDPDEIHYFDAFYASPNNLIRWIRRHVAQDAGPSQPFQRSGAFRGIYGDVTNTKTNMETTRNALCTALAGTNGLGDRYRIEQTSVGHCAVPRRYGWRLLDDAAATLPDTTPIRCPRPARPTTPAKPAAGAEPE